MRAKTGEQVDSYIPVIHDRIESDRLGFNWIGSDRIASHRIHYRIVAVDRKESRAGSRLTIFDTI